jgi:hypothetical protein
MGSHPTTVRLIVDVARGDGSHGRATVRVPLHPGWG